MEISIETIRKAFKKYHADASGGAPCKTEAIEAEAYQHGALWMQETLQLLQLQSFQEANEGLERLVEQKDDEIRRLSEEYNKLSIALKKRDEEIDRLASLVLEEQTRANNNYRYVVEGDRKNDGLRKENHDLRTLVDDRAVTINSMSDAIVKKELEIATLKEALAKGSLLGCSQCQHEMLDAKADAKNARIELEDLKSKIIENAIELAGFTRLV